MPTDNPYKEGGKVFDLFPHEAGEVIDADKFVEHEQTVAGVIKLREQIPRLGSLLTLILASDMPNDEVANLVDNIANGAIDTATVRDELLQNVRAKSKHTTSKPIG